jgi:hypothetical protein
MNTLTFVSSADLPDPIAPLAKTDLGSRVVKIFLAREGDTITVAGTDYPTVAEITSAISASEDRFNNELIQQFGDQLDILDALYA